MGRRLFPVTAIALWGSSLARVSKFDPRSDKQCWMFKTP